MAVGVRNCVLYNCESVLGAPTAGKDRVESSRSWRVRSDAAMTTLVGQLCWEIVVELLVVRETVLKLLSPASFCRRGSG